MILEFYILCHHVELFDSLLNRVSAQYSFMVDLLLEGLNRPVSHHHLILQVFNPVLLQVARKLQVVILLLETLVLKDGDAKLLLQLPVLMPQFQSLLQSQRLLS